MPDELGKCPASIPEALGGDPGLTDMAECRIPDWEGRTELCNAAGIAGGDGSNGLSCLGDIWPGL
jgi:hypothetical protein